MYFHEINSSIVLSGTVTEPLTAEEARQQTWCDAPLEDTLFNRLITVCRKTVERHLARAIPSQTFTLRMDCFPCDAIQIRMPPVSAVSSVQYVATDGTTTTWSSSDWQAGLNGEPPIIIPAYGESWPSTREQLDAVTVTGTAGFSTVPEDYKHAILLLLAHMYRNREATTEVRLEDTPLSYQYQIRLLSWGDYS